MNAVRAIVTASFLSVVSLNANADFTVDKGAIRSWRAQDVVISISKNPNDYPEEACLALTMAQILRQSGKKVNVTLFLRNDGVFLADKESVPDTDCMVPDGLGGVKLVTMLENLEAAIDGNESNLVNCPLCWGARVAAMEIEDEVPDFGVLASEAIPPLLLGADKVIDF